jgi:hypothetical protein
MGTVAEMERLIVAGYGPRLMRRSWWLSEKGTDAICLMPAEVGCEGKDMLNYFSPSTCTFFKDGKCELHDLGLKPLEGRVAIHDDRTGREINRALALEWDKPRGQSLVKAWQQVMEATAPTLEGVPA